MHSFSLSLELISIISQSFPRPEIFPNLKMGTYYGDVILHWHLTIAVKTVPYYTGDCKLRESFRVWVIHWTWALKTNTEWWFVRDPRLLMEGKNVYIVIRLETMVFISRIFTPSPRLSWRHTPSPGSHDVTHPAASQQVAQVRRARYDVMVRWPVMGHLWPGEQEAFPDKNRLVWSWPGSRPGDRPAGRPGDRPAGRPGTGPGAG